MTETLSARLEEEVAESYKRACNDLGKDYSSPFKELAERFGQDKAFRDFYVDLMSDDRAFEEILSAHQEVGQLDLDDELLEDGTRRVKAGLAQRHEPMAYEGAEVLSDVNVHLGQEVEDALDSIGETYWEVTR